MSQKVKEILDETKQSSHNYLYETSDSVYEKIDKIAKNAYGANGYELSNLAKQQLKELENYKERRRSFYWDKKVSNLKKVLESSYSI